MNTTTPTTKPGMYGTLYLYRIVYRDLDPGCPDFTTRRWAYCEEDAIDAFNDGPDAEGWLFVSITRETDRPAHRQTTHAVNLRT
jgi:hypothetical protein